MLSPTISALQQMSLSENQTLSTAELLRATGFPRSELFRIFGNLERAGIVSQTGYTFLGVIQGYRLETDITELPLLAVFDAVGVGLESGSAPNFPGTEGSRRYESARAHFEQALGAITLKEFQ